MLENLVRKILEMVGINDATDEQIIVFILKLFDIEILTI